MPAQKPASARHHKTLLVLSANCAMSVRRRGPSLTWNLPISASQLTAACHSLVVASRAQHVLTQSSTVISVPANAKFPTRRACARRSPPFARVNSARFAGVMGKHMVTRALRRRRVFRWSMRANAEKANRKHVVALPASSALREKFASMIPQTTAIRNAGALIVPAYARPDRANKHGQPLSPVLGKHKC